MVDLETYDLWCSYSFSNTFKKRDDSIGISINYFFITTQTPIFGKNIMKFSDTPKIPFPEDQLFIFISSKLKWGWGDFIFTVYVTI